MRFCKPGYVLKNVYERVRLVKHQVGRGGGGENVGSACSVGGWLWASHYTPHTAARRVPAAYGVRADRRAAGSHDGHVLRVLTFRY